MQTLTFTRMAIAAVLLVYLRVGSDNLHATSLHFYAETCMAYLIGGGVFALLAIYRRRNFLIQLGAQVALDLAVISMLYVAAGGIRSSLAILYLFPLAGAAILAPLLLSLFAAALSTMVVIGHSSFQLLTFEGETAQLLQAGVYGAMFFALVLVVGSLARRLIGQEQLASRRGADLAIQLAINQIVMFDVGDGILVVDAAGTVLTSNPAARRMLGVAANANANADADADADLLTLAAPALAPLADAFSSWRGVDTGAGAAYVVIKPEQDASGTRSVRPELAAHLKLRFARVDTASAASARFVVFLQDVTAIENQAQQLKLASMGRLTASIAHEVRNPLSAIGHATSLLAEDLADPGHARLLKIVADNVARVNRMVEDILQLSRKVQPQTLPHALAPFLADIGAEFEETHALPPALIDMQAGSAAVRFDPLHLREVVVNLLTNAIRYASGTPGSIRVFVVSDAPGRLELHVQDDGPGITPEVRAHLFEPFYTTSSKGTGLGLYLARELCLNNGAMLDYEYRIDAGHFGLRKPTGRFVVSFAHGTALPLEKVLP
ncbi:sensor histidine kinase [Massilia sp. PWRC2]|uniref:sensor histidine kinase n=1 Tax=Massilia sp. PWRC2 TaxID=2804626 RepID=UPI003CEA6C66